MSKPKDNQNPKKVDLLDNILNTLNEGTPPSPYTVPTARPNRVYERIYRYPAVYKAVSPISTEYQNKKLREIIANTLKVDDLEAYMGSISTVFSRKHFPVVQGNEYLICTVSDGMKFMFFVCEEGVFLVDKKFHFFRLECSGMEMFARERGRSSLLEGELVMDRKTKQVVFYFSDAIQINGEYCAHANFTERLNLILSKIISCQKTKTTPFELNKKRFYSKSDIGKLIKQNISFKNSHWWYQDEKRCYLIQSILFKPNEPFPLLSTKQIFEKRLVNTAHFWIRNRENHYALSVLSDFGETEFKEVSFNQREVNTIENHLNKRKNEEKTAQVPVPVVTCTYNPQKGEWNVMEFPKKMRPSKARSVLEMLLAVAENVKEDELVYRVPRKTEEDEWWKEKKIDVNE